MADRSIVVRLRAEVSDFNRQIGSAATSLDALAKRAGGQERVAQTTLGRIAQSAQLQRESWDTVGSGLLKVGAATTAVGAAALATGISYNSMQQASRAALTTMLGSTEAAAAQMQRLDNFARTSPFAKDVFIRAQQQMLGFGIEARKVIPYLDAIQQSVAATGGSNNDISELTRIFSQVQAAAKITAVDLMQFGQRGIDAATLIGSQMGKTGEQIRGEITAGTLDAGQALDALAAGMQDRFGGAADNVKATFSGAVDRVKAAWRDLSSELASPLVGAEGGGIGTAALNELADAMRAFQDAPGWVKGATAALGGLGSAGALTAGALLVGIPRYIEFRTALSELASVSPGATAAMGKVGGALLTVGKAAVGATVAAGAVLAVAGSVRLLVDAARGIDTSARMTATSVGEMSLALREAADSGSTWSAVFAHLADEGRVNTRMFGDLASAIENVANQNAFDRFLSGLNLDATGVGDMTREFESLGEALASLPLDQAQERFAAMWAEAGGSDEAGRDLLEIMPAYADALYAAADQAGLATSEFDLLAAASGNLAPGILGAADAAGALGEATGGVVDDAAAAAQAYQEWADTMTGAQGAFTDAAGAFQELADASADGVVSMGEWIASLQEQAAAQAAWRDNLLAISDQIRTEMPADMEAAANAMIDELAALGPEGAQALQTFRDASASERVALVQAWQGAGSEVGNGFAAELAAARKPTVDIDTTPAIISLNGLMVRVDQSTGEVTIDGRTVDARDSLAQLMGLVADSNGAVTINGQTVPAQTSLGAFLSQVGRSSASVRVSASTSEAERNIAAFVGRRWTTTVYVRTAGIGGGMTAAALADGGFVKAQAARPQLLPGRNAGGWVPGQYPGPGRDNVLWPLASGGRTLWQPLAGREFVVNARSASQHSDLLHAINEGRYRPMPARAGDTIIINAVPTDHAEAVASAVMFGKRAYDRPGRYRGGA